MKPIIGITSSQTKLSELSQGVYVHEDYFLGVEECGGLPVVLPDVETRPVDEKAF